MADEITTVPEEQDLTYMDCWHYIAPLIPVKSGSIATKIYVMVFQALK